MVFYKFGKDKIQEVKSPTFSEAGITERDDLQRLLKDKIEVISPETLIISEEFSSWQDSKRRVDLLGIDKNLNLIVIELKRTEDGGHMDLQAIRYAAMVSPLGFDKALGIYGEYLRKNEKEGDPEGDPKEKIFEFLRKNGLKDFEEDEIVERFGKEVKIILASADFSTEITTTVIWLNTTYGLDIKCVKLKLYEDQGNLFLEAQQIIPLPEAEEYQVELRNKTQLERRARESSRDLTKFNVTIDGHTEINLSKRKAVFTIIHSLCSSGISPEELIERVPGLNERIYCSVSGKLTAEEIVKSLSEQYRQSGKEFSTIRWFCKEDELIFSGGKTFIFTDHGNLNTENLIDAFIQEFPDQNISYETQ